MASMDLVLIGVSILQLAHSKLCCEGEGKEDRSSHRRLTQPQAGDGSCLSKPLIHIKRSTSLPAAATHHRPRKQV
eukprot:scaffold24452_cov61-Phaeocystis_antarctica.AAC.2